MTKRIRFVKDHAERGRTWRAGGFDLVGPERAADFVRRGLAVVVGEPPRPGGLETRSRGFDYPPARTHRTR